MRPIPRFLIPLGVLLAIGGCDSSTSPDSDDPAGTEAGTGEVDSTSAGVTDPGPTTQTAGSSSSSTTSSSTTAPGAETTATAATTVADESGSSSESDDSDTDGPPEIPAECVGSALADVVEGMEPGSWAQLPASASLGALEMSYALLYWADSAVFDPVTRQVHWVGGPGSCCADPATYQRISYDELSDVWSIEATPFAQSGHAYDANAFDPESGAHLFALAHDPAVHRFQDGQWDTLPEIPINPATTMALTWFPERDELLYVGGSGEAALFDGDAWSRLDAPGQNWGTYNTFSEYSPVHGVVWLGGGNGANSVNYLLDASGQLVEQDPAPINLGNGGAIHTVDPASGNFIVLNRNDQVWWEFDPVDSSWSQLAMDGAPSFDGASVFHVPLTHCGVTMYLRHYWEDREIYLYRHG